MLPSAELTLDVQIANEIGALFFQLAQPHRGEPKGRSAAQFEPMSRRIGVSIFNKCQNFYFMGGSQKARPVITALIQSVCVIGQATY